MKRIKIGKIKKLFSKKWMIIAILVIAVIGIFLYFQAAPKGTKTPAVSSSQTQVTYRDITATITGTAVVKPNDEYSVTSLVSGDVVSANFEEGDFVQEGDVLYQLDASDIEKNISSADVAIRKAQNNYNEAVKSKNDTNVVSDATGVIKTLHVKEGDTVQSGGKIADIYDDSVMELTIPFVESDISKIYAGSEASITVVGTNDTLTGTVSSINNASYAKAGNMLVCDVVIHVENPGVITNTDKATASIGEVTCNDVGQFNYITEKTITAKTSGTVEKINITSGNRVSAGSVIVQLDNDTLDSSITTNSLSLEDAQISKSKTVSQLEDYTITAPISGQVITKNTKAGDKLDNTNKQEAMAVIYDMSLLKFDLMVDELDINKVSIGQEVKITADALNGKEYIGYVDKISIDGTESNGVTSYPVSVSIKEFDSNLLPGMNIDAEIAVGSVTNVLSVPKSAVTRDNIVYVAGEKEDVLDTAPEGYKSVTVITGLNDGNYIEIQSGLSEEDIVKIETINSETTPAGGMGMGGAGGGMPSGGASAGGGMPR